MCVCVCVWGGGGGGGGVGSKFWWEGMGFRKCCKLDHTVRSEAQF